MGRNSVGRSLLFALPRRDNYCWRLSPNASEAKVNNGNFVAKLSAVCPRQSGPAIFEIISAALARPLQRAGLFRRSGAKTRPMTRDALKTENRSVVYSDAKWYFDSRGPRKVNLVISSSSFFGITRRISNRARRVSFYGRVTDARNILRASIVDNREIARLRETPRNLPQNDVARCVTSVCNFACVTAQVPAIARLSTTADKKLRRLRSLARYRRAR